MIKKRLMIAVLLVLGVLFRPALAQGGDVVRVGIFQNKPLSFTDENGIVQGIYPDVVREIARHENWTVEFVKGSWAENLERLSRGNIDLMVSIVYSEKRDVVFDFSTEPVVTAWGQVYAVRNSGILSVLDLEGKTVAIMGKDINAENFKVLCRQFNVSCDFISVDSYDHVCRLIIERRVDAGIINNINGEFLKRTHPVFSTPIMFNPVDALFAVPEAKNNEILSAIDAHLAAWRQDQDSAYYQILGRWFGTSRDKHLLVRLIVIILSVSAGILFGSFVLVWLFRRQVAVRTKALSDSEEKYRLLFNSSNDGVLVHQSQPGEVLSCFLEVNDVACRMYGYTREEFSKIAIDSLVPSGKEGVVAEAIEMVFSAGAHVFENLHQRKNGDIFPVEISAYLFEFNETPTILSIVRDISSRKQAEKALIESEEKYRMLVENQLDLVVKVDIDGRFLFVSQSYCRMFGKTESELIGKRFMPLVHQDDQAVTEEAMKDLFQPPYSAYMEQRAMTGNGWRWLAWVDTAVLDENNQVVSIIGVGRDITEKKEVEGALKTSQETFLTVLDGIDAVIYVSDLETYEILFMNKYMKDTYGGDLTGKKCYRVLCDVSAPCGHCTNSDLFDDQGQPGRVQVWNDQNPITKRWYINQGRAIKWMDGRYVRLQVATDITQIREMEAELRQAHKMETIGTLAGGVAHDFNNILGIIIGYAELALYEIPEWNPSYDNIKEIKTASLRAKDVVQQLLSFSRKSEQEQKPLDISHVIRETLQLIRSSMPANIDIRENIPETCDPILGDATQIHQILINLCNNASHAMTEKGGTLDVMVEPFLQEGPIWDGSREYVPGNYIRLVVKDTGTGMESGMYEKIFDPYFTTKEVGEGTGMGLAVVHGIVQNHGGHIFVDSEPGKGTEFTILFPIVESYSHDIETKTDETPDLKGTETVLFVDDEVSLVKLAEKILTSLGYRVRAFTDPLDALAAFRSAPEIFDLVISDMTMPQMSGLSLAERLKKIRSDLPVIILTGHSALDDEPRAKEIGISAYAMKPVTMSEIAHLIREVLKK